MTTSPDSEKNVGVQKAYTGNIKYCVLEAIQEKRKKVKTHTNLEALTVSFHCALFCSALLKLASPPASSSARGRTSVIHSFRGRPTLRIYLEVAGSSEPGTKDISDNGLLRRANHFAEKNELSLKQQSRSAFPASSVPNSLIRGARQVWWRDGAKTLCLKTIEAS